MVDGLGAVSRFVEANKRRVIVVAALLGLLLMVVLVTGGLMLKDRFSEWRYDNKMEKLEKEIGTSEQASQDADAQSAVLNEEGNRKFDEYKNSNVETTRLRRELQSRDATIGRLREEVRIAGTRSTGPTVSDRELCERANRLGILCDTSALGTGTQSNPPASPR